MRKLVWIVPLALMVIVIVALLYVNLALPNVGPAPDIKVEITPERVARGEYLANTVMSCVDCHSKRDFSLFSAPTMEPHYIGGSAEFTEETGAPGNFYATNLTPYHLKDWTDGEIYRAITAGVSKDGRALFPAMPYLAFGNAADEDIYSVIAYLRTLPSREGTVPEPEAKFPFSIIMKFIPKKGTPGTIPPKSDILAYGEYMITIAACMDCHTPMEKGQLVMEKKYAGGSEFHLPGGTVRSANITPDTETGIGAWTEETFINRFRAYGDSLFTPQKVGDGFNTVMPWTQYAKMDEYDLKAIYAYLRSLDPVKNQVFKYSPKN